MPPIVHSVEAQAIVAAHIRYFQHHCSSLAAAEQIKYATTVCVSLFVSQRSADRDEETNSTSVERPIQTSATESRAGRDAEHCSIHVDG